MYRYRRIMLYCCNLYKNSKVSNSTFHNFLKHRRRKLLSSTFRTPSSSTWSLALIICSLPTPPGTRCAKTSRKCASWETTMSFFWLKKWTQLLGEKKKHHEAGCVSWNTYKRNGVISVTSKLTKMCNLPVSQEDKSNERKCSGCRLVLL